MIKLNSPEGVGRSIETVSFYPNEAEVLLPPYTAMVLKKKTSSERGTEYSACCRKTCPVDSYNSIWACVQRKRERLKSGLIECARRNRAFQCDQS